MQTTKKQIVIKIFCILMTIFMLPSNYANIIYASEAEPTQNTIELPNSEEEQTTENDNSTTEQDNKTGIFLENNSYYYYVNGVIATDITTLVKYDNIWWYVENGKVNTDVITLFKFNDTWWIPVYIGNERIDELVVSATQRANYRSGGR